MFRITEDPSSGSLVQYRTIFVILAKYCTRLPDDGSSVIRCWSTFKYFIILIVYTYYIIVHKLDNKIFIVRENNNHFTRETAHNF